MPRARSPAKNNSTANLGFEPRGRGIWLAAGNLRTCKHTNLGLIFLKDIKTKWEVVENGR